MEDNPKLIMGGVGVVFAIVITTLFLSTGSSRCLTEPFWQGTNIEGIYYCAEDDSYRACSSLSSTNKTCYHITNSTQINQDFSGYSIRWILVEDDPTINSTILKADLNEGGIVELDLIVDDEHKIWYSNNRTGDIIISENETGNVSLQFSILSEVFYLHVGNESDIYKFTVTESLSSNDVKDVYIYDLEEDDIDYTTWYNDSSKSWWQEANDTVVDNGLLFDGTNDYVETAGNEDISFGLDNFTINFWLSHDLSSYSSNTIITSNINGSIWVDIADQFLVYFPSANTIRLLHWDGSTTRFVAVTSNKNVLNKITFVRRGSTVYVYKNGAYTGNSFNFGTNPFNVQKLGFGRQDTRDNYYYKGILDEVTIFDRALTDDEINQSYLRELGHESNNITNGLVGYWDFDGNQNSYEDNSVNTNDATPYGDVKFTGRSSQNSFPTKAYPVLNDNGLDILDAENESDTILWKSNVTVKDEIALAENGNIYLSNNTGLYNWSFIGDTYDNLVTTGDYNNIHFDSTETYWSNTTHLIKSNTANDFSFTESDNLNINNIKAITSGTSWIYAGNSSGVQKINKSTFTYESTIFNGNITGLSISNDYNYLYTTNYQNGIYEIGLSDNSVKNVWNSNLLSLNLSSIDTDISTNWNDSSNDRTILAGTDDNGAFSIYSARDPTSIVVNITLNSTILNKDVDSLLAECTAIGTAINIEDYIFNITYPNGTLLYEDLTINTSVILTPDNLTVAGIYTSNCYAVNGTVSDYDSKTFNVVQKPTIENITFENGPDYIKVDCDGTSATSTVENYTLVINSTGEKVTLTDCSYYFTNLNSGEYHTIDINLTDAIGLVNEYTYSTFTRPEESDWRPYRNAVGDWYLALKEWWYLETRSIYFYSIDMTKQFRFYLDESDNEFKFTNNASINYTFDNFVTAPNLQYKANEVNVTITVSGGSGTGTLTNDFNSLETLQITVLPTSPINNYTILVDAENGIEDLGTNNTVYTGNSMLPYQVKSPGSSYINFNLNNVTIDENITIRTRWSK